MSTQIQKRSRIVWAVDATPVEHDEVKSLLETNGFDSVEFDGGLDVTQNRAPAALPPELNDQIACLIYVFGVFDRPIVEQIEKVSGQ